MSKEKFNQIREVYRQYTRELLKKGHLPLRSTSKGFWNPASDDEVYAAFKQIGLEKYKRFLDIGSGDGRVVHIASLFTPKAEGVEIDEALHKVAAAMQKKLDTTAAFHCKDAFAHDLSAYDALFINPDAPMERGMENKILAEMKGHLIHYGHHFRPQFLEKKAAVEVNGTPVTVYAKYPQR